MAWHEIQIHTTEAYANELSDQLSTLGAAAVTFQDAADQPIFEPTKDTLILWPKTLVVALFEEETPLEPVLDFIEKAKTTGKINQVQKKKIEEENWERKCLESFKPIQCADHLWVCPSWLEPPDPDAINVILDPGLAFGTGTHPTTRLCLNWLANHTTPGQTIIDFGCGSGILAIAALKLGAKKAIAIDHDPQALEATQQNALLNHIQEAKLSVQFHNDSFQSRGNFPYPTDTTQTPDNFPSPADTFQSEIGTFQSHTGNFQSQTDTLNGKADILVANILANPLIELASYFQELVKPGGKVVLSGILLNQIEAINDAYSPFFQMEKPFFLEDWVLLVGTKL